MILTIGLFIFTPKAQATILSEPTCSVQAEILEIGSMNPSGQTQEYDQKYTKFKILSVKKLGSSGNCEFLKVGDITQTNGGSSAEVLKKGQFIEASANYNVAMGPMGTIPFIQWQPIVIIDAGKVIMLPKDFHLQSSADDL